jgi:hypothetical protein
MRWQGLAGGFRLLPQLSTLSSLAAVVALLGRLVAAALVAIGRRLSLQLLLGLQSR